MTQKTQVGHGVEVGEEFSAPATSKEGLGTIDQRPASGICVRITEQDLVRKIFQGCEQGVHFFECIARDGHRVVYDKNGRRSQIEREPFFNLFSAEQCSSSEMI